MSSGLIAVVDGVDTDLDDVFEPRGGAVPAADATNLYVGTQDLADRYRKTIGSDQIDFNTGFITADDTDLRYIFRKKGWLPPAPSITSFTYDGPKYEGEHITLEVTFSGIEVTNVTFRSPSGTVLLSGGDVAYPFTPSSYTQSGTYSVEVENAGGSDTAYLDVTIYEIVDPPVITGYSGAGSYEVGDTVNLSVTATGADSYQWYAEDGSTLSGATSSSYSFTASSPDQSGNWKVRVSNAGGFVEHTFSLSISYPPTPPSVTVTSDKSSYHIGETAHFTATATGDGTKSYQWYSYDGAPISGATSSTYSVAIFSIDQTGTWSCKVTTAYGEDTDGTYITVL